jgi:hypothetical protein
MNSCLAHLLAQSDSIAQPLIWSVILIVILMILFAAVGLYRKWMKSEDTGGGEGFTLSDLRRLHKSGQMTDEEFEKAKKVLIGSVKSAAEKMGQTPPLTRRDPLNPPKQGPRTFPPQFDADSPEK